MEGDWTPNKTNLFYSPPKEVGVSSSFKIKDFLNYVSGKEGAGRLVKGLDDAVKKAASLAQMDDYRRKDYPAAEDWMERLLKETIQTDDNYLNSQFRELLGSHYQEWVMIRTAEKRNRLQATLPYSIVVE